MLRVENNHSEQDNEAIVTVLFNGTSSNINDANSSIYSDNGKIIGETVSVLRKNIVGSDLYTYLTHDIINDQEKSKTVKSFYLGVDGVGSGNKDYMQRFVASTMKSANLQMIFGYGVNENINHVLTGLESLQKSGVKISKVNFIGWSRGAAACITTASRMHASHELNNISVNIFGIDPVPGPGRINHGNLFLTNNVANACFIYAEHERSLGFEPVVPKTDVFSNANVDYVLMPGHHGTLVGNPSLRHKKNNKIKLVEPGKIVRWMAEQFLIKHGTQIKNTLVLNRADLLDLFNVIKDNLKKGTYLSLQKDVNTLPQLKVIRKTWSPQPIKLTTFSKIPALEEQFDVARRKGYVNSLHRFLMEDTKAEPQEYFNPKPHETNSIKGKLYQFKKIINVFSEQSAYQPIAESLNTLYQELDTICVARKYNPKNLFYPAFILETFIAFAQDAPSMPKEMLYERIVKISKNLDTKLMLVEEKKPIKKELKAAVCGVIGAVVGFAVGICVGAISTTWGGCFGALPGAILGAYTGLYSGSTYGFFRGKIKKAEFKADVALLKKSKMVAEEIKTIFSSNGENPQPFYARSA